MAGNNANNNKEIYKGYVTSLWIIILGVIILNIILLPKYLPFWEFTVQDVLLLLFSLFIVATFIERAVEVIIIVWRDKGKEEKSTAITLAKLPPEQQPLSFRNRKDKNGESMTLGAAIKEHAEYSAMTKKLATPLTFTMGLVISALGIRALQPLIDPAVFNTLTITQRILFAVMDILVTGALLGGGSKGIHEIIELILNTAENYRRLLREK